MTEGSTEKRGHRRGLLAGAAVAVAAGLAGAALGVSLERSAGEETVVTTTVTTTTPAAAAARTATAVAAAAAPGVVSILATSSVEDRFAPGPREAVAEGSGFVLDRQGHILTCEHVIEGATKIHVTFADGTKVHATVVGSDPLLDLAVLEVDVPAATLQPLALGSSTELKLGDPVVAIGNPFGLERSVSAGVVSGLRRQITAPNGFTISNAVQTDAAVNHGNSGGPLLDARGRVVGVNAQLAESGVDANVGVAFAVAIDEAVARDIAQLRDEGAVEHAWLGVSLDDIDAILATSERVHASEGALVTGVVAGGPADEAGLRGGSQLVVVDGLQYCLGGDVITAVDGEQIEDSGALQTAIGAAEPGDEVTLALVRSDGSRKDVTVTLGTQPAAAPEASTGCR